MLQLEHDLKDITLELYEQLDKSQHFFTKQGKELFKFQNSRVFLLISKIRAIIIGNQLTKLSIHCKYKDSEDTTGTDAVIHTCTGKNSLPLGNIVTLIIPINKDETFN